MTPRLDFHIAINAAHLDLRAAEKMPMEACGPALLSAIDKLQEAYRIAADATLNIEVQEILDIMAA